MKKCLEICAIKGGGVGRLMANAILNFHFDYLNPSLNCNLLLWFNQWIMLRMRVWVKHFILFGSFQLEENWRLVFFIAVIFDPTCLNQEQDKNWSQGLIWAQHIFLEYIQTLNTKSGTNLTLISFAPARTRKPRLRISSTHSEQRNLWNIYFDAFLHIFKIFFQFFTFLLEQQR